MIKLIVYLFVLICIFNCNQSSQIKTNSHSVDSIPTLDNLLETVWVKDSITFYTTPVIYEHLVFISNQPDFAFSLIDGKKLEFKNSEARNEIKSLCNISNFVFFCDNFIKKVNIYSGNEKKYDDNPNYINKVVPLENSKELLWKDGVMYEFDFVKETKDYRLSNAVYKATMPEVSIRIILKSENALYLTAKINPILEGLGTFLLKISLPDYKVVWEKTIHNSFLPSLLISNRLFFNDSFGNLGFVETETGKIDTIKNNIDFYSDFPLKYSHDTIFIPIDKKIIAFHAKELKIIWSSDVADIIYSTLATIDKYILVYSEKFGSNVAINRKDGKICFAGWKTTEPFINKKSNKIQECVTFSNQNARFICGVTDNNKMIGFKIKKR